MERLSLAAFWVSLASCGLATALAWARLVPWRRAIARTNLATAGVEVSGGRAGLAMSATSSSRGRDLAGVLRATVLVALAVSLVARGIAAGRPPLADLWEFTVAFAAAVTVFQVVFAARTNLVNADVALQPLVLFLLIVAAVLPSRVEPLAPSLRSNDILVAHVTVMLAAYGALTVSFGAAILQLWQASARRLSALPGPQRFDEIAYRAVVIGFPLLAAGIALGAYWANTAWGRYWGWDPKETSALVTWLSIAAYFHARAGTGSVAGAPGIRRIVPAKIRRGWRPDPMWWLIVMWGLVMFTYFAVNLWVHGLHSYAGV